MRHWLASVAACAFFSAAQAAGAASILIPDGTIVFGQLDERITSNSRKFRVGFEPYGHVWKDVVVNGVTVIAEGTPVSLQISRLDPRGVGGAGAEIQIMALSVEAVDGTEIDLRGGYGQETPDRTGLSRALGAILWPAGFIPGRRAVLEEGLVFDMEIPRGIFIDVPDDFIPTLNLTRVTGLSVEIEYEEFDQRSGELPLQIRVCGEDWTNDIAISAVNQKRIPAIPVELGRRVYDDECHIASAFVDVETLSKHFDKGINRFTLRLGELEREVVLNVEM